MMRNFFSHSTAMKLLNTCYVNANPWQYHGVAFLESFNNSQIFPVDLFRRFATEIGLAGK